MDLDALVDSCQAENYLACDIPVLLLPFGSREELIGAPVEVAMKEGRRGVWLATTRLTR